MSVTLELDSARRELAALPEVDVERMAMERLGRLQAEMAARDVGGMLLYDPVNVRYATGTRNMQVWAMHNSSRYCLVPAEGGVLVFDFVHCEHLSEHLPTVAESRPARMWIFHIAGARRSEVMADWAAELADEIRLRCPNRRIAVDRLDGDPRRALEAHGVEVSFGQDLYGLAHEQVHHNMALLGPGLTMRELAERSWRIPDRYEPLECGALIHGIGLCNEYPQLVPRKWYDELGYDAVLEPDMTVCVESYIGEPGGHEGVKLEEMVRITETGCELVAQFPFEEELLP